MNPPPPFIIGHPVDIFRRLRSVSLYHRPVHNQDAGIISQGNSDPPNKTFRYTPCSITISTVPKAEETADRSLIDQGTVESNNIAKELRSGRGISSTRPLLLMSEITIQIQTLPKENWQVEHSMVEDHFRSRQPPRIVRPHCLQPVIVSMSRLDSSILETIN